MSKKTLQAKLHPAIVHCHLSPDASNETIEAINAMVEKARTMSADEIKSMSTKKSIKS